MATTYNWNEKRKKDKGEIDNKRQKKKMKKIFVIFKENNAYDKNRM